MAKRTNRVTWGLAVVLAVVLLGGGGLLGVHYHSRVPKGAIWLALLPPPAWGFGRMEMAIAARVPLPPEEWVILGFFMVRVK
jgi:hypothetical protein